MVIVKPEQESGLHDSESVISFTTEIRGRYIVLVTIILVHQ